METKIKTIKDYLEAGNYVDDAKAVDLCRSYRLSAIIYTLRHDYNMNIQDRWRENQDTVTRYKEYYLNKTGDELIGG